ncbi:MAG: hypothetical protein GX631_10930 [Dehalococcoidales bacterium]|nr:hypothetical protein [Dehalococcoidales bacterium]
MKAVNNSISGVEEAVAKYTVEMFGLTSVVSGKRKAEMELGENVKLTDIVHGLKKVAPSLAGEVIHRDTDYLMEGFAFNINGRFYSDDRNLVLKESDRIILLAMATIG